MSLLHGSGHDRAGIELRVAAAHPGVSLKDLADEQATENVTGYAVLNGTPVRVPRARVPVPGHSQSR